MAQATVSATDVYNYPNGDGTLKFQISVLKLYTIFHSFFYSPSHELRLMILYAILGFSRILLSCTLRQNIKLQAAEELILLYFLKVSCLCLSFLTKNILVFLFLFVGCRSSLLFPLCSLVFAFLINTVPFFLNNRYQIAGGNDDKRFRIDPSSGEIYVHAPLDRETVPKYHLKIKASDRPIHPANQRSSFIFVNVSLTDVNDNKPLFKAGSYYAAVKETADVGDDIVTVQATDADAGQWMTIISFFMPS